MRVGFFASPPDAFHAAAAGGERVVAALPIDGIGGCGMEQRQHPPGGSAVVSGRREQRFLVIGEGNVGAAPAVASARLRIRNRPAGAGLHARGLSIARWLGRRRKAATIHRPALGANSRQALEWGRRRCPARSTAALDRTAIAERTLRAVRDQAFAGSIDDPVFFIHGAAVQQVVDYAAAGRTSRLSSGLSPMRAGATGCAAELRTCVAENGKAGAEANRRIVGAGGRVQPILEHAQARHRGRDRRSKGNRCDRCGPRGRDRPNRGRCARARTLSSTHKALKTPAGMIQLRASPRTRGRWPEPGRPPDPRRRPVRLRCAPEE